MPYRLRKAPNKDLYWVVNTETGKKHSKEPLPRERAEAQVKALYANVPEARGGMDPVPNEEKSDKDYIKEVEAYLGECKKALTTQDPHGDVSSAGLQAHFTELERRVKRADNSGFLSLGDRMEELAKLIKTYKVAMETRGMGKVSISKKAFVKEHKNLLGVLKRGKKSELRAEAKDQAKELANVVGGGPIPDRNILQQLATQSYKQVPLNRVGQFELVRATPTLKFYRDNGNTIIVAIRGSKTMEDWTDANSRIAIGQLENSDRYKTDLNTLTQFQTQYPPSQYDYYGVGHSLGGAILDGFLKAGLIKNGVSYNPAVQPQDFQNTTLPNERIYSKSDPLYALMGRNLAKKPETRAPRKRSFWETAASYIPFAGTVMKGYDLFQSHQLNQFQGGAKAHSKFDKQLRKVGIEPSLYLKEAQRRAKDAGLPYKVLGFADDGDHKLAIPNADGRMIKFGKVGYGDHLIWSHLERTGSSPKGTADAKRNTFQKSHSKIKGDWKKDPFSPNSLALKVLW